MQMQLELHQEKTAHDELESMVIQQCQQVYYLQIQTEEMGEKQAEEIIYFQDHQLAREQHIVTLQGQLKHAHDTMAKAGGDSQHKDAKYQKEAKRLKDAIQHQGKKVERLRVAEMSAAQAQKVADLQRVAARADLTKVLSEKQDADVRLQNEEVEAEATRVTLVRELRMKQNS